MDRRLSDETREFIEDLVTEFMSKGRSFTSVDIANLAKDEGHYARNRMVAGWLRHNAIVLAHSYGYLYNQTLIEVDSKADGHTLAYLYHHMNVNADDYLDRDQNPKPYRTIPNTSVNNRTATLIADDDNATRTVDALVHDVHQRSLGVNKSQQRGSFTTTGGGQHQTPPANPNQQRDRFGRFATKGVGSVSKPPLRDPKGRFIG